MFLLVYIYIFLTYIEPFIIFLYILHFVHPIILPYASVLVYPDISRVFLFTSTYYYYVFLF